MAFPTTQKSDYADLKGRITLALSRCQEQPWLDFKESQPWPVLRWQDYERWHEQVVEKNKERWPD